MVKEVRNLMNEVVKNILERRSWRSYEDRQISDRELDTILQCGLWAPSAMNQQSWHFTVVQNKERMAALTKGCQKMMDTDRDPFYGAPTLVVVTAKADCIAPQQDGSLAIENMMLAASPWASALAGYDCLARFLTTEDGKAFAEKVGIPAGYVGVSCLILGYPQGERPEPKERAQGTVNFVK